MDEDSVNHLMVAQTRAPALPSECSNQLANVPQMYFLPAGLVVALFNGELGRNRAKI